MLGSIVCRYDHFLTDWYARWATAIGFNVSDRESPIHVHRKVWEWCAIAQALYERGLLAAGKRGCGFAVGREPLASLFAAHGVDVLATDIGQEGADAWESTGQHAASVEALFMENLVPREAFDAHVRFRPLDMRRFGELEGQRFHFLWSSCAIEHLGSLADGLDFVEQSMALLEPGGVAVHTTEFNVSSNDETLEVGSNVAYRRRDLERFADRIRRATCGVAPFDFDAGTHRYDLEFDYPPYHEHGRRHLKLLLGDFVCTSMLLVVHKGSPPT
jgi:hypothetical protein